MNLLDLLRSLAGAFAHPMRAMLTMLGIVIGTGSIVLLASLIDGGEAYLKGANQSLNDEDIVVAWGKSPPPKQATQSTRALTRTDAQEIGEGLPTDAVVAAESSRDDFAEYKGQKKRVGLVSSTPRTVSLYRLTIAQGRDLDSEDRVNGRKSCVIGHAIHEELLKKAPIHGDTPIVLTIDNHPFTVVGVLAHKPTMGGGDSTWSWNRKVIIPATTFDALYAPSHEVRKVFARKSAQDKSATKTRAKVASVLLQRHLGVQNFELSKDESGGMGALILQIIRALLLSTGVLALVASGINIMNVMLVTVTERTREIGLRRAIGASPRSILIQFLLEAATLSFVGALIGVVAGIGVAWLVAVGARAGIGEWQLMVPSWSIVLGIALAMVTGLSFGILPAWRASRVSPIDALRAD